MAHLAYNLSASSNFGAAAPPDGPSHGVRMPEPSGSGTLRPSPTPISAQTVAIPRCPNAPFKLAGRPGAEWLEVLIWEPRCTSPSQQTCDSMQRCACGRQRWRSRQDFSTWRNVYRGCEIAAICSRWSGYPAEKRHRSGQPGDERLEQLRVGVTLKVGSGGVRQEGATANVAGEFAVTADQRWKSKTTPPELPAAATQRQASAARLVPPSALIVA